jgi:predicted transposase/invertase (TIGR01784 family)
METTRKPLTELTLMNRFLFAESMENPENMNIILDIILENEIHLAGKPQTEKELRRSSVYRMARLDVWAESTDETLYNTEVQEKNTYNLPKRFRFYQAMIDSQLLETGTTDFNRLNGLYLIMIMPFDLFGYGKYCYTFDLQCMEVPGLELQDDVTWLFLNTHGTNDAEVSPELVELLHYFEHTNDAGYEISSEKVKRLQQNVKSVQENAEVSVKYMQLWEEKALEREEARAEGIQDKQCQIIRNMLSRGMSDEDIMALAECSQEEVDKVRQG